MKEFENDLWYLLAGTLMGMVLAFWFTWDIDFYREEWPIMLTVLILWALVRELWNKKKEDKDGDKTVSASR